MKDKQIKKLQQQLYQLKAENELLKINNAQFIKDNEFLAKRNSKLKAKGQAEQKLERITNILFTGQCSNCEGYSPNCSNKELCDFKHNIKNIIDEVNNES